MDSSSPALQSHRVYRDPHYIVDRHDLGRGSTFEWHVLNFHRTNVLDRGVEEVQGLWISSANSKYDTSVRGGERWTNCTITNQKPKKQKKRMRWTNLPSSRTRMES